MKRQEKKGLYLIIGGLLLCFTIFLLPIGTIMIIVGIAIMASEF